MLKSMIQAEEIFSVFIKIDVPVSNQPSFRTMLGMIQE